jgi:hypothetical protein
MTTTVTETDDHQFTDVETNTLFGNPLHVSYIKDKRTGIEVRTETTEGKTAAREENWVKLRSANEARHR